MLTERSQSAIVLSMEEVMNSFPCSAQQKYSGGIDKLPYRESTQGGTLYLHDANKAEDTSYYVWRQGQMDENSEPVKYYLCQKSPTQM